VLRAKDALEVDAARTFVAAASLILTRDGWLT
jgi:hypothetical protein